MCNFYKKNWMFTFTTRTPIETLRKQKNGFLFPDYKIAVKNEKNPFQDSFGGCLLVETRKIDSNWGQEENKLYICR